MATLTFTASLSSFELKTKEAMSAIVRQSAQDVIEAANTPQPSVKQTGGAFEIGKVPVDTGFLRNSLATLLNGGSGLQGGDAYIAVLAEAGVGDVIEARWTAEYAVAVEYGSRNVQPRMFVRYNVERWQAIVEANAQRIAGARR